jgi:hypothetical protein
MYLVNLVSENNYIYVKELKPVGRINALLEEFIFHIMLSISSDIKQIFY